MEATTPVASSELLRLVQQALNEFDSASRPATIRRTTRIASLLGESKTAIKLGLDLKASGGGPSSNAEMTRRLMADPESWREPDSEAEVAVDEWMAGRTVDDGMIAGHSLGSLLFWEERFNVAFRRLREADTDAVDNGAAASEALSQCLTSCRRILKAVVDVVQPVDPDRKESEDGHSLADDKCKNRLFEYLTTSINSTSYLSATKHDAQSLYERFDAVASVSSKGCSRARGAQRSRVRRASHLPSCRSDPRHHRIRHAEMTSPASQIATTLK